MGFVRLKNKAMTKFHIDKGLEANLPSEGRADEGHLYVTSDNGNAYFAPSDDGVLLPLNRSPYYLTCATAAGTPTKSALMPNGEVFPISLGVGMLVVVKFSASNTATSPSLKITDGQERVYQPIPIKRYGTTAVGANASVSWNANEAVAFVYDGSNWLMLNHIPSLATGSVEGLVKVPSANGLSVSSGVLQLVLASADANGAMRHEDFNKVNAVTIPNGTDLDDYTTVGTYATFGGYLGSEAQQNTGHTPTGAAGAFMLVVLRTSKASSDICRKQIYMQANGRIWSREYYNSSWSYWNEWDLSKVNDAVLTIKRNNVAIDTFSANASSNKSINIVVPTKTSDLSNDSDFANNTDVVHKTGHETIGGNKTFTGNVTILDNVLTIDSSNQAKHPVGMSLNNYYDDGVDGVAVLAFDDSNGDGNVILRFVHDPIESYDAATKGYVDDIAGDIETLLASI